MNCRNIAFAVLVVINTPDILKAQNRLSLAETQRQFDDAILSDSIERLALFYAEDAVMMVQAGPMLKGRQQIVEQFLLPSAKTGLSTTAKTLEVADSGDLGFSAGTITLKGPAGTLGGKWVTVWKRVQGEWKIAYIIANSDPPPPKQ